MVEILTSKLPNLEMSPNSLNALPLRKAKEPLDVEEEGVDAVGEVASVVDEDAAAVVDAVVGARLGVVLRQSKLALLLPKDNRTLRLRPHHRVLPPRAIIPQKVKTGKGPAADASTDQGADPVEKAPVVEEAVVVEGVVVFLVRQEKTTAHLPRQPFLSPTFPSLWMTMAFLNSSKPTIL